MMMNSDDAKVICYSYFKLHSPGDFYNWLKWTHHRKHAWPKSFFTWSPYFFSTFTFRLFFLLFFPWLVIPQMYSQGLLLLWYISQFSFYIRINKSQCNKYVGFEKSVVFFLALLWNENFLERNRKIISNYYIIIGHIIRLMKRMCKMSGTYSSAFHVLCVIMCLSLHSPCHWDFFIPNN